MNMEHFSKLEDDLQSDIIVDQLSATEWQELNLQKTIDTIFLNLNKKIVYKEKLQYNSQNQYIF